MRLELRHLWIAITVSAVLIVSSVQSDFQHDLWWHMAIGRWVLEHGQFLHADVFSHTAAGRLVVDHDWIPELILYKTYQVGGVKLVGLLATTVYTCAFGIVLLTCWKRAGHCRIVAACGVVSILLSYQNQSLRPQMFAFALFAAELFVLWHVSTKWKPLALGLLMLLWVNSHKSYVLGVVLPAIFLAGRAINLFLIEGRGPKVASFFVRMFRSDPPLRSYLLGFLVTIAAAFCNPQPLLTFRFVGEAASNAVQFDILEWRPVGLSMATGYYLCGSVALMFVVLNLSKKRIEPVEALLLTFFIFLAAKSGRLVIWWAMVVPPILAAHLVTLVKKEDPLRERAIQKPLLNMLLVVCLIVATLSPWIRPSRVTRPEPDALSNFLKVQGYSGNIFNPMGWGGYLMWFNPELKIFADGRVDPFPAQVWNDYEIILRGEAGWEDLLDRYKIELVIGSKEMTGTLICNSSNSSRWKKVFDDSHGTVFERKKN
jgi:hypothetical protein